MNPKGGLTAMGSLGIVIFLHRLIEPVIYYFVIDTTIMMNSIILLLSIIPVIFAICKDKISSKYIFND